MFGFDLPASASTPIRDGIADLVTSISGNVIVRVMRENEAGGTVSQVAHVVLTPRDVDRLMQALDAARVYADERTRVEERPS